MQLLSVVGTEPIADPTVIPWKFVWFGLLLIAVGAVLAMHGIGQRMPSRVADTGAIVAVLGIILMLVPPLVNGTVMLAQVFGSAAQQAAADTQAHASNNDPR